MIAGAGGIGRRFWAWVCLTLSTVFDLTANGSLGELLLRNLLKALLMKAKHTLENNKFDTTIPENLRERWLTMIQDWESDKSNPNPYTHTETGNARISCRIALHAHIFQATNLAEVRRQLAEADEQDIARGVVSHQVPGSVFIRGGLELEEQQLASLYRLYANQILIVHFITGDSSRLLSRRRHRSQPIRLL